MGKFVTSATHLWYSLFPWILALEWNLNPSNVISIVVGKVHSETLSSFHHLIDEISDDTVICVVVDDRPLMSPTLETLSHWNLPIVVSAHLSRLVLVDDSWLL